MQQTINITNYTCNGKCSCCGQCCGDLLHLSKREINLIDNYLKKHKVEATPQNIMFDYDNTCPFRDNKNKICKIYEVRPDICRIFKCDKSPNEALKNRELTNEGKPLRSMRNLFFNDNKGAIWGMKHLKLMILDRNDKLIELEPRK